MANSTGESLGKAIEELVQQVVETAIASLRSEIRSESGAVQPSPASGAAGADGKPGAELSISTVNSAVAAILEGTSQTDIMTAALRGAAALGGRAALFVRKGDQFSAWRSEGFSAPTASKMRAIGIPATQPGIFQELCEEAKPLCRVSSAASLPAPLQESLTSSGAEVCLLPILVQGKVVSALYSDSAGASGSEHMSALEILASVAGLSLETVASRAETMASRASAGSSSVQPSVSADSAAASPLEAMPETALREKAELQPAASSVPATQESALFAAPPNVDSLPEPDRESHRKAYRFARVAVQDLLSYHKDKIEQGRRNKNLFDLLKEDIEKTRQNYQRRFGRTAAQSFDYLHYEMVAKLADNDPSRLGEQYPGPSHGAAEPLAQQT